MSFFKRRTNQSTTPSLDFTLLTDMTHFLENHPDAVYTMDLKGNFIAFNNKLPLLLGYPTDAIRGMHFSELLIKSEAERIAPLKHRVHEGETIHFTTDIQRKDGQILTVNVTNIPLYNQHVIIGLYGIARDVSQQKELRTAYNRLLAKEQLTTTLDGVTFLEYIPSTKQLTADAALSQLLEWSQRHVAQMDAYELLDEIHPEDRDLFLQQSTALCDEQIAEFSMSLRMSKRRHYTKVVRCDSLLQQNSSPRCVNFILHDATELTSLERERDHAIQSLKDVFGSLDTSIYEHIYHPQTVTFQSAGFLAPYQHILNRIEKEPQLWRTLIHPEDLPHLELSYPEIRNGKVIRHVYRLQLLDNVFWIEETCIPILDNKGDVSGHYGVSSDITILKEQQHTIWHLSMHDSLTQLPNRAFLLEEITSLLKTRTSFTLLAVTFKQYNVIHERFGHDVGDEWIRQTSTEVRRFADQDHFVGHLFGDKYLFIIKKPIDETAIVKLSHQLLKLSEKRFDVLSYELFTNVYIGITYVVNDKLSADELLKQTYTALRRAKSRTKSNYQFYSTTLDIDMYRRYELERDLRYAIQNEQLVLEYQPKVDGWNGNIQGAEALIRWNHPEWGRLTPKDFLSLSEESEMYLHIGDWVLDQTCRFLSKLREQRHSNIVPISINVSPKRLFYGDFGQVIEQYLKRYRVPGHLLEIELLESDILLESDKIHEILERISALGVHISLDDFGTAYSSISHVQRYPINCLKIDRSLAQLIEHDPKSRSIVKSILFMAKEFQLTVVAEGIETIPQLDFYRELQCDLIQGYLFSKPVSESTFEKLLTKGMLYPQHTGTAAPVEAILSLFAQITITRLNGRAIQVGSSDILINRCTNKTLFFYSSIRLPIHQNIELNVTLASLIHPEIFLVPASITELDNGLFHYAADFKVRALSSLVQEQLKHSQPSFLEDVLEPPS